LLVNNAGVAPRACGQTAEASGESFDRLIGINVKGPYFLISLALDDRTKPSGRASQSTTENCDDLVGQRYAASVNRGDHCVSKPR
jgi:NAD(P)-dependent dehydrogenase (short-subunit alcohol dehydrogenase family)